VPPQCQNAAFWPWENQQGLFDHGQILEPPPQFSKSLTSFFQSSPINFRSELICELFVRVIRVLGKLFQPFWSPMVFSLFPWSPDCFLIIACSVIRNNPSLLDRVFILGAFQRADPSTSIIGACVSFATTYPAHAFKLIRCCTSKLKGGAVLLLSFLHRFAFASQFLMQGDWDVAIDAFTNRDEDVRLQSIPALMEVIRRDPIDIQQ
jgi:hypothetical protein